MAKSARTFGIPCQTLTYPPPNCFRRLTHPLRRAYHRPRFSALLILLMGFPAESHRIRQTVTAMAQISPAFFALVGPYTYNQY